jgi:hypothetical protein
VYAKWQIDKLPGDFRDFYIQCGDGEEEWESYTIDDIQAKLIINSNRDGFLVELICKDEITAPNNFWLSPECINDEFDAFDFGFKE